MHQISQYIRHILLITDILNFFVTNRYEYTEYLKNMIFIVHFIKTNAFLSIILKNIQYFFIETQTDIFYKKKIR